MEKYHRAHLSNSRMKKVVFGIIIVVVGLLLLASNFGELPRYLRNIIFSWQMLLIAIGLINLASRESKSVGLILIAVGSFFLLPDIFVFSFDFVELFWPILLIVVGVSMIMFGGRALRWRNRYKTSTIDSGFLDVVTIFGGTEKRIANQVFKGGDVVNIFGGTEIDLTQAILNEGTNVLEITCVFGGINLVVPADWNVRWEVASIFGGFSDKRHIIKTSADDNNVLVVKGIGIFYGGEIKSY
ncbi:MAG: cell wall-active antibiotics response protein [Bacteroidetes bacterium]|nr:cell wall-active antibiotics response protein [Bacteroidota bacterium]